MESYLDNEEISRYSRQLIVPEIGVQGQLKLKASRVLIIGAGGLGCPAAQYLTSAGVGTIGIVDYDTVEISNLHRQILHTENAVTKLWSKAESAAATLQQLNSSTDIKPISIQLNRENAPGLFKEYDIIVDATDNVTSRYLINDISVLMDKPLVSGSALRWEGQLTIYHYTDKNGTTGPCYRCLYPIPPPPESVTNCSDGGVIGVVPGIIGCMQALETIKIIIGSEPSFHQKLYLFDGLTGSSRTIKLRPKQLSCKCCGENPTISLNSLPDYVSFCGVSANDKCRVLKILASKDRITVKEYQEIKKKLEKHVLVDVRNPVELGICSLPDSINIPISLLQTIEAQFSNGNSDLSRFYEVKELETRLLDLGEKSLQTQDYERTALPHFPVYVICRMGNDSQRAVQILEKVFAAYPSVKFQDIKGGLMAWASQIDTSMPQY